jgi:signal transduction histidine kinase
VLAGSAPVSVGELRGVPLLSGLTDGQLGWISSRGEEVRLRAGSVIARQGEPADGFYVVLEGETAWSRRVGREEVHAVTLGAGEVFAELILLIDAPYPTTGRATTDVRLFKLPPGAFWEMLGVCPEVLRGVVRVAVERSRIHESVSQIQARLISLGTLAAGFAHELNNPASAAHRAARNARESLNTTTQRALALASHALTPEQRALVANLPTEASVRPAPMLGPLERGDREDEVALWLEERGVEDAPYLSPTLVAAGLDVPWLETVAERLPEGALADVLSWLAADLEADATLREAEAGARRVSELVGAVREYAFLDEAPLGEVDVREGLENSLAMLGHKLDGVEVTRDYEEGLPRITAYGSELNQARTALLENALDAAGSAEGGGHIRVRASRENGMLFVEVADDGPGIPEEARDRIFEPFFTTKDVGAVGLGLDLARRTVGRHGGEIRLNTRPGETNFQVRLPLAPGGTRDGMGPADREGAA